MTAPRFLPAALAALLLASASAQQPASAPLAAVSAAGAPAPRGPLTPGDAGFTPTWETQKGARTYVLGIPAPRGQIVDRNGSPLAQTRVSYNLAIAFPTPLNFTDTAVERFAQRQIATARSIIGRTITVAPEQVLKHYKNRGAVPLVIAQDLKPAELETYHREKPENLTLQPVYLRFYPNGALASHVLGYAGRDGRMPDGPIENNELLWPNARGRAGLEESFDAQMQGKVGQYNISFDPAGKKASEQISIPPQPGYNVVTTLDENIQRQCEIALEKGCKRGAMVVIDPNNGDVLAMASWPMFNPNAFIPNISAEEFKALQDDKDNPLLPRAFYSAYPPGSVFKCFVGLAALATHKIEPDDEWNCPAALEIGNLTFRNWKKEGTGMLNFADALTQSCNTWFYQVGMKIGSKTISDYAFQLGLGKKTGIPMPSETEGRIPTDEYMLKTYKRRLLNGDVANFSIGQGDTLITPLQMAQAMGALGNGGTLYQTRLVQQVQSIDGQVVTPYNIRVKGQVELDDKSLATVKQGMIQVVSSRSGTAGRAAIPGFQVAGKTGTAQWGPKNNERTAAWFAGFVPAESPKYAFAAVYEGDAGNDEVHGGTFAAPIVGRVMRELFKNEPRGGKGKKKKTRVENEDGEMVEVETDAGADEPDQPRARRSRPSAPEQRAAPPPPPQSRPQRVPFFRRLFGF